jgi:hypothetical protein
VATPSQAINNNLTTVWTCCRHSPCRGGWGNVVPTTTDSSHPVSAGPSFASLVADTSPLPPHLLPAVAKNSVHFSPVPATFSADEKESAIFSAMSQRATIALLLHPERSAFDENSSPDHATQGAVATPKLQDVRFLEFPEGAREWWTRMTSGAVNESRTVTSSSTRGESR